MISIQFIPFIASRIVPEGKYIFLTDRNSEFQKRGIVSTTLKKVGGKMVHDIRNQRVTHISTEQIDNI